MSALALAHLQRPVNKSLPTMYDLPYEEIEEPGMPDEYHPYQAVLLSETFQPTTAPPGHVFTAMDLYVYYDQAHPLWYKRPDWFAVIGVPRLYEGHDLRYSYVVWQEGVAPLVIVELLSERTKKEDLGRSLRDASSPPSKWEVYERILQVPYYILFGRDSDELRIFKLGANGYEEVIEHGGRILIPEAGLSLGLWRGVYLEAERSWLRWQDAQGNWIPTNAERAELERQQKEAALRREGRLLEQVEQERQRTGQASQRAEQERQRAEQERQRAEQERQRAERLAELLRQMGQDPGAL